MFKRVFLSFSLFLGYTSLVQADSLGASSDSFQVSSDVQPSLVGMQFAAASKTKKHASMDSDSSVSAFDDAQLFVQFHGAYDFAFLGDVTNGANQWVALGKAATATTSGGGNNSGINTGALVGLHLDKSNSLALDLGGVFNFGNNFSITTGTGNIVGTCTPTLLSASLDYLLDIANSPGSRTYLIGGVGYYHTDVSYNLTASGVSAANGTWSGDTVGGTLGIGEEISLGGILGLDLSVRGRYASFNKVSSTTGTPLAGGTGSSSMAILSTPSGGVTYNVLVPINDSTISGSGGVIRDAVVDFSGIEANAALDLYFN